MLKGFDKNGNVKNVMLTENGSIPVSMGEVAITQTSDKEVVLNASILTLTEEIQTININKKVTQISIANYSDTGDVTMSITDKQYQIGSSLAIDFPINEVISSINLTATTESKIQLVVKGVE